MNKNQKKSNREFEVSQPNELPQQQLKSLHNIINQSYLNSESDFWKDGYERISIHELKNELNHKNLLVLNSDEGQVSGCVKVDFDPVSNIGTFSMLCVDDTHRGLGLGNTLVKAAEKVILDLKGVKMGLDLLIPRSYSHPDKEVLKKWYTKLGYQKIGFGKFEDHHPQLVPIMKIECDFERWEKIL